MKYKKICDLCKKKAYAEYEIRTKQPNYVINDEDQEFITKAWGCPLKRSIPENCPYILEHTLNTKEEVK
jgi:hypothetical protein